MDFVGTIAQPGFDEVVGYASEGDRAVVASRNGKVALFIIGADRRPIMTWHSPEPIAVLGLEHNPDRNRRDFFGRKALLLAFLSEHSRTRAVCG